MVNKITEAERERIYRRAKQLRLSGVASMSELTNALIAEFDISRARARSAVTRVICAERTEVRKAQK